MIGLLVEVIDNMSTLQNLKIVLVIVNKYFLKKFPYQLIKHFSVKLESAIHISSNQVSSLAFGNQGWSE